MILKESGPSADNGSESELVDGTTIVETETHIVNPMETQNRAIPPTNYLRIFKVNVGVEGQYVVDLSLPPPSMPGAIAQDTDPKNLSLHTTCGRIDAEIWIIHDGTGNPRRVTLNMCTDSGAIRAILHDPSFPDGNSHARPALDVRMHANYGDVLVSLPRRFRGHIAIRTSDERIAFSPALKECTALLSDVPGSRVYFVGDRPRGGAGGTGRGDDTPLAEDEPLDELSVDGKYTSVRINWDGEAEPPGLWPDGWTSFFSGADRFFSTGRMW